jgi:hypothetical protein
LHALAFRPDLHDFASFNMLSSEKGQKIIGLLLGVAALLGVLSAMHSGLDIP